jgi:hypothetical protein
MTRFEVIQEVSRNLNDLGRVFWTAQDLLDSFQDALDDIYALIQVEVKEVTLNWQNDLSYYIWKDLGITDYLYTIAIFNNNTNLFLDDSTSLRNLDAIRNDWETWIAEPFLWAPVAFDRIVIVPKKEIATGTFKHIYATIAPIITVDTELLNLPPDMQSLLVDYMTGDLLEQAEEFKKAQMYWQTYFAAIIEYSKRRHSLAGSDLLLRI